MKVKLVAIGGKKAGMEIPITTKTFTIGSGDWCHLRPQCDFVNLVHCQILLDRGSVAIEDSSGAVGTFVNGEKIKWRTILKHGDHIRVGTLELEVRIDSEAKEEVPIAAAAVPRATPKAGREDGEPDIAKWVGGDENGGEKHVPGSALPLAAASAIIAGEPPATAAAVEEQRPKRPRWREIEVEWQGADLLLLISIGVMVIVLLCMTFPMIPWPELHPVGWYWIRICWYWTYCTWPKLALIGFFAGMVTLFVWLHSRRLNRMQS